MKRVITAVVLTTACGLGVIGGAAPASAATRPVVVYEPAFTGSHPVKSVVRPPSWYLTISNLAGGRPEHAPPLRRGVPLEAAGAVSSMCHASHMHPLGTCWPYNS